MLVRGINLYEFCGLDSRIKGRWYFSMCASYMHLGTFLAFVMLQKLKEKGNNEDRYSAV